MSYSSEAIELSREVEAIQIPSGATMTLPQGTLVAITQSLGGTYTVHLLKLGGLCRILAKDADALGQEVSASGPAGAAASAEAGAVQVSEDAVWEQLKTCYDPEIPVNIVDLGLIYSMEIKPVEPSGNLVEVKMTLTAPGCGMGPSIAADAQHKILTVPGVTDAQVDVVWDPPWSADRISPEGRSRLGMI
ncbi:MAG TPA: putative Fe-S cluster assembly protein SufT [Candidatus Methylacidiphilales bacterium]|nr:putative Fe-S cluster assembly protein SufT [Candidatus Methylacidiphilales bacterium]